MSVSFAAFTAFAVLALTAVCSAGPATFTATGTALVPTEQLRPEPYEFGFQFDDGLGMNQYRREVADDTGAVKGSYGYIDPFGVRRTVEYTADKDGFKAVIKSNEPGTAAQNSANTEYIVQPPPAAVVAEGMKNSVL